MLRYELLTGSLPFDHKELRQAGFGEIQRIIREKEPPRPSTWITQLGSASTEAATNRHTEPRRLALLYGLEGKNAQAELLYTRVLETQRRVLGEQHPDTVRSITSLGLLYLNMGKNGQAETTLRTALNAYEKVSPDSWERFNCASILGASLTGQKKYQEAEPLVIGGYEAMSRRKATIPAGSSSALDQAGRRIVQLYRSWRKTAKAADGRARSSARRPAALSDLCCRGVPLPRQPTAE